MRTLPIACFTLLLLTACGLETEPNPDFQAGTGAGASGGSGGSGARDGGDAGGEGGTTGGSSGSSGGGSGGITGGTGGGSAGDAAIPDDCQEDSECPATRPQCNAQGKCSVCTSSAACEDRDALEFCETTAGSSQRGQCVACMEDDHCADSQDGDYCNGNKCVPCKTNADCDDLTKPQCGDDGQCTGCTTSDACDGRDGTEVCRTAAGPTRGHCVACIENNDCKDLNAPQCQSDNTCGSCTADDACTGREGTEHCSLRAGAETFGDCVQCTGATEDADCGTKSCKQTTGECTETEQGSLNPCQSCEADTECGSGTKCVAHSINSTSLGYFCFYDRATQGGSCADTISGLKPYSQTLTDTVSIDGTEEAAYCLPRKSCEAILDTINAVDCETAGVFDSTVCGLSGLNEGQCPPAGDAPGFCTYVCTSGNDCPDNKPSCENDLCSP